MEKRNLNKHFAQGFQPNSAGTAPKIPKFNQTNTQNQNNYGAMSYGQQTSSGPDRTPGHRTPGGRLSRPYEFDSCISTEEAFFAHNEEHKWPMIQRDRSNPQEDGTPPQ